MRGKLYYRICPCAYYSLDAELVEGGTHVVSIYVFPYAVYEQPIRGDPFKKRRLSSFVRLVLGPFLCINCTDNLLVLRIFILAKEIMRISPFVHMLMRSWIVQIVRMCTVTVTWFIFTFTFTLVEEVQKLSMCIGHSNLLTQRTPNLFCFFEIRIVLIMRNRLGWLRLSEHDDWLCLVQNNLHRMLLASTCILYCLLAL